MKYKCKKCGKECDREKTTKGYFVYCPNCDEDKYSFEVEKIPETKYYIKVENGDRYETEYSDLKSALESLTEYQKEGWEGLVIEDENYKEYDTNDVITEIFFDMLAEKKSWKEIQKATGLLKAEEDESQTVLTLYYPNGEIISHWV